MPQRMTTQRISTEQDDIHRQRQRADADAKAFLAGCGINKPDCLPNIVRKEAEQDECCVKKIAMGVLDDERKGMLAKVTLARLAYRAGRRIRPKGFVVGAAVIIASQAKQT